MRASAEYDDVVLQQAHPSVVRLDRDWGWLGGKWPLMLPLAVFSLFLGFPVLGWLIFPLAVAIWLTSGVLVALLERVQTRRRGSGAALAYRVNASQGRVPGPGWMRFDVQGITWWSYAQRRGDPEVILRWSDLEACTVEPLAAAMPICRLRWSPAPCPDDGFVMSISARRLHRILREQ